MVNKLLQPQEIEVFYVLPALRRELTMCMKEQGKTQKVIAKLLGVTEPAISQYVKNKRAKSVQFEGKLKTEIEVSSSRIKDELSLFREIQRLMGIARSERVICKIHAQLGNVPTECGVCFDEDPK